MADILVPTKSPNASASVEAVNAGIGGIVAVGIVDALAAKVPALADPTIKAGLYGLLTLGFAWVSKWFRKQSENAALAVQPVRPVETVTGGRLVFGPGADKPTGPPLTQAAADALVDAALDATKP